MVRGVKRSVAAFASTFAILGVVDLTSAEATTICVPGFSAACPDSGGNVAVADLEQAMSTDGKDGTADEVRVGAGTFTENATFEPAGGSADTFEVQGTDP